MFAHEEFRKHVYVYDHKTRSVDYLAGENSCWPVKWLLARYHRRHVLCGHGLPEMAPQRLQVKNLVNKLRWTAYFSTRGKGPNEEKEDRRIIKNIPHRSTPRCGEVFCARDRSVAFEPTGRPLDHHGRTHQEGEVLGSGYKVLQPSSPGDMGLETHEDKCWAALPNDKELGFTVMNKDELKTMVLGAFESEKYEQVSTLSTPLTMMKGEYTSLCQRIARLEGAPREAVRVRNNALVPVARFDTVFQATLKTHTPHRQICIRPVHAGRRHAAAGVSMWLSDQLQSVLDKLSRFVIDSTAFCLWSSACEILAPT